MERDLGIFFTQKEKIARKIEILADFCGRSNRHRLPNASLIKIISNLLCEKRIIHTISTNELSLDNPKFDAYYRQKSAFATTKILDHVKNLLSANTLEATINTEVSTDFARYDAIVAFGKSYEVNALENDQVRIEIKASLGLDLEQIGRYLWVCSPLILVRVITGQVARIYPSEVQSYVTFSLNELSAKIDRLLSQNYSELPGTDCAGCSNSACAHWRGKNNKNRSMVTLPDSEFSQDLSLFFQNLSYVAERTAIMVVEELRRFESARKQKGEACLTQNWTNSRMQNSKEEDN